MYCSPTEAPCNSVDSKLDTTHPSYVSNVPIMNQAHPTQCAATKLHKKNFVNRTIPYLMCIELSNLLKIRDMRNTLAILANRNKRINLGKRAIPCPVCSGGDMKSYGKHEMTSNINQLFA